MSVTKMIDGRTKRNHKQGFELQSLHVIEKHSSFKLKQPVNMLMCDQNLATCISCTNYIFVVFSWQLVKGMDPTTTPSQVLIRVLAKKPGWKDTNFQVNKDVGANC